MVWAGRPPHTVGDRTYSATPARLLVPVAPVYGRTGQYRVTKSLIAA